MRGAMSENSSSRKNKVMGFFILVVAIVILGFAAESAWTSYSESAEWQHGEGKVIRVLSKTGTGRRGRKVTHHTPIFRFTAQGERFARTVTSDESIPFTSFKVGETVEVIYPADAPEKARINSFLLLYCNSCLLGIVGLILLLAGIKTCSFSPTSAPDGKREQAQS